jgi:stage IV sporulation protein FB
VIGSLRVGSVLGIKVRVHYLLLLLIGYILIAQGNVPVPGTHEVSPLVMILMLFAAVTLHELGHSIVAQSFGIRVLDITLWPLGGMARMSEVPESSKIEGLVAVAGPIVNFILAALTAPVWLWAGAGGEERLWLLGISQTFLFINLLMGAFNLIPAFPTDGGRILRAFLGRRGDWLRATQTAVRVGRVFSVAIALAGLLFGDVVLVIIAIWLWWMGSQELTAVRMRHAPTPFDVLRDAARRAAASWASSNAEGPRAEEPEAARARGFTAEEIEKLERFRGNLRNFRPQ